MAVPARKTSTSKKGKRRSHQAKQAPTLTLDPQTGTYHRRHHIDLKAYLASHPKGGNK